MVQTFRDVIRLWPSLEAMANETGAAASAVSKWNQRNSIPAEWWVAVVKSPTGRTKRLTFDKLASLAASKRVEAAE